VANNMKDLEVSGGKLGDIIASLEDDTSTGLEKIGKVMALRMNQYNNIELDEKDVRRMIRGFMDIEVGSATNLVQICSKKTCLYKTRCFLFTADKCPEGRECVHENKVLGHAMGQYLQSLEVDTDNYPEMVMVNQLVEFELMEYRCNAILSFTHRDLKMITVIGLDEQGIPITKEDISYAFQIKERVLKQKMQILTELAATRKEKWKRQAALKEAKDGPAKVISNMKKQLKEKREKEVDYEDVHNELNALSDDVEPGEY